MRFSDNLTEDPPGEGANVRHASSPASEPRQSSGQSRAVLIVEPHLEGLTGHPARYVRAFAGCFEHMGWRSLVLAHRHYDGPRDIDGATIDPVFRRSYYETRERNHLWFRDMFRPLARFVRTSFRSKNLTRNPLRAAGTVLLLILVAPLGALLAAPYILIRAMLAAKGLPSTRDTLSDFTQTVAQAIDRESARTDDLRILIPTATTSMLAELLALPAILKGPLPPMALVFHEDPRFYRNWYRPLELDALADRLRASGWKPGLRFFATNARLAKMMAGLLDAEVTNFGDVIRPEEVAAFARIAAGMPEPDIALPAYEEALLARLAAHRERGNRLAVCLGPLREDKGASGFARMAGALDVRSFGFRLVVQAPERPLGLRDDVLALKSHKHVDIIDRPLSEAGYLALLRIADIVLLPYDPNAYACRVSRVFMEAALAGRPILASAGMASEDHAAEAIVRFIEHWKTWPEDADALLGARGEQAADMALRQCAGDAWKSWMHAAAWLCLSAKPIIARRPVLYVRPSWFSSGSATVFDRQMRHLAAKGFPVVEAIVEPHCKPRYRRARWQAALNDRAQSPALLTCWSSPRSGLTALFRRLRFRARMKGRSHAAYMAEITRLSPLPPLIRAIDRKRGFSFIVVNHYFHLPFIAPLSGSAPVWLETHDVQSRQMMIRGDKNRFTRRPDPIENLLADEMSYMRTADVIGAINTEEEILFRERLGEDADKVLLCQPSISLPAAKKTAEPCDVLIVASDNPANIANLSWFVHDVLPRMKSTASIRVVGNIDRLAARKNLIADGIEYTGAVRDLAAHYAATRVVALPVVAGAGIAIKALEAFAAGRAIVASPLAYRGLPQHFEPPSPAPTSCADVFAATLDQLLRSPAAEHAAARSTRDAHVKLGMDARFHAQMDDAIARLLNLPRGIIARGVQE